MSINTLYTIADYSIQSNMVEDSILFKYNSPSLNFATGAPSYIMKDLSRQFNEGFSFWFYTSNVTTFTIKILLGCDDLGNGYAIELSQYNIKLITISTFVESAVILDQYIYPWLLNSHWHNMKLLISNGKIEFFINDGSILQYNEFVKVGDHFGYHNNNSPVTMYISDTIWYDDQIVWGNVNVNGANNQDGFVLLYKQIDLILHQSTITDINGNWMMLMEEDPVEQNKHVLVGGITSDDNLQPKGISSVTL